MKPFKVAVTRRIPEAGLRLLRNNCRHLTVNPKGRALTRRELLRAVRGTDGILSLLTDRIDAAVMDAAGPGLKVISNYAVGVDNIDVAEATKRKILVTNTPGVLTQATAELAWALLFATARRVVEGDNFTRTGKFKGWEPMLLLGHDVGGKTLGVVGAGRIGTAFALMSKGFRMQVLYTSRRRNGTLEKELGAAQVPLATLLKRSDFISIHTSLTPGTRRLIGRKEIAMMKPSAILINTARGPIVDEKALVAALREKKIAGAGLDVYENEPALSSGLSRIPNAVLLPHVGSGTLETREKMAVMAAGNLLAALEGKMPPNPVNPQIFK